MTAKTSISRVPASQHPARHIRHAAIISTILALLLVVAGALSFSAANRLMRQNAKPLDSFTSNILPNFSLANIPSLDEQSMLSGWFFPAEKKPISTIILVHDQGKNRLQFGVDSARLYQYLVDQGYNILAFDLRNSGQSGGEMSGYGYAEWEDVLAAIKYVRKNAVTTDVLLFGFGTGVSASLIALDQLPPAGTVSGKDGADNPALKDYSKAIQNLGYDQSYIRGLLLDTPCKSPDDYIRAILRQEGLLGRVLLQYTVPYAIRLSAGSVSQTNLTTILTRSQLPVFLTYSSQDTQVGESVITPLVIERQRLHPDSTDVFVTNQPGYVSGYLLDQDAYLDALGKFLNRYFK